MSGAIDAIDVKLGADEWALIRALRAVPDGPLKARVLAFIDALLVFVREPRCAGMQGDGVPCGTADAQCDECLQVAALVDELTRRTSGGLGTRRVG
jgi:hypothetical protein